MLAAGDLVDEFAAGRVARAVADAAEIRLLDRAWAGVLTSPVANRDERRSAEIAQRSLVAEFATAVRVSEWTASRLLGEAHDLCRRFPAAVAALEEGRISRQHLAVIHDAGGSLLDDDARGAFVAAVLKRAVTLTPGLLKPVARILADRYAERPVDDRCAEAAAGRRVEVCDLPDGVSQLVFNGPATLVHGIDDRLTAQARQIIADREADATGQTVPDVDSAPPRDTRTLAQIRADLFTDLLLCGAPSPQLGDGLEAIRAVVQVTVPVLRMAGASDEPIVLAGYGPVDSETARRLAAGARGWERVMTCPTTGTPVAVDRYRPGKALQRFLRARDEGCRFPGCTRPVWRADLDHTIAAADGGPTTPGNLAHLCRRHHTLKHATAWTVHQEEAGVLVWTSPHGRRHTDIPRPTVRFEPDDDTLSRRSVFHEPWLFTPEEQDDTDRPEF